MYYYYIANNLFLFLETFDTFKTCKMIIRPLGTITMLVSYKDDFVKLLRTHQ